MLNATLLFWRFLIHKRLYLVCFLPGDKKIDGLFDKNVNCIHTELDALVPLECSIEIIPSSYAQKSKSTLLRSAI